MAVTHHDTTRNAISDAVVDLIDVGGAGTLEFLTAADAEVATVTFSATAFGNSVAGVATASAITADTNATGSASPVTKFVIKSGGTSEILYGSVGTSGEDINLTSVIIGATDTVELTALTYTAPA